MTFLIISNSENEIREEIHRFISEKIKDINEKKLEEIIHPDVHFLNGLTKQESIGIADIRAFTKTLHKKPFKAKIHLGIILGFEKTTVEAQNALLKEFEDHPPTVSYILGVVDENSLLPTIRSRATVKYISAAIQPQEQKSLLTLVQYFIDSKEDLLSGFSAVQKKEWTRATAESFLSELYTKLSKTKGNKKHLMLLQKCSEYLRNNISPKQVLSYLLLGFRHKI
ncbi:hypothetical protein IT418_02490 [bacterium]|nr:hypothetical protein [bacterium]